MLVAISGCIAASSVYTPDQLVAAAEGLVGKTVVVQGAAVAYSITCTKMVCTPGQCCNTCGSPLALAGEKVKIRLRGSFELRGIGCFGDECTQACYPLVLGKRYQVAGTLLDDGAEYYLDFISYQNVST